MTYADQLTRFYLSLKPPSGLPPGVDVLFPFQEKEVKRIISLFYKKYFNDTAPRRLILGINPGRFGAGVTGINFTAPRQLKNELGIDHGFSDHSELSAEFIYKIIAEYGGPELFYGQFFIGSISPLGYMKDGVNLNYYDDKNLASAINPFIVSGLKKLRSIGFDDGRCFCIGGGKNYVFLKKLNTLHGIFNEIIPLPHPRFIMQYKRRQVDAYITQYMEKLK